MQKLSVGVFTLILVVLSPCRRSRSSKIRFSTTSIAVTEMQFRMAQMKGFYREEGLDLETLLIRGAVGMQALIGASVDSKHSSHFKRREKSFYYEWTA